MMMLPANDPVRSDDLDDPEEQLHDMARMWALREARSGYNRSGRGAVVVPWPPEGRLSVSFLPETACLHFGSDSLARIATYDPEKQFVMIYLFTDGTTDAYTYFIPARLRALLDTDRDGTARSGATVH